MNKNSVESSPIFNKDSNEENADESESQEMSYSSDVEDDSHESKDHSETNASIQFLRIKQPDTPNDSSTQKKDSLTLFNDYLNGDGEFNYEVISKCSAMEISVYLEILLKYFYKNFCDVSFCKEVLYLIYRKSRYTVKGKAAFLAASGELFGQEFNKISKNSNWNDVVMFGALLCKLLRHNKPGLFEVTKQLNVWILELINCSAEGNENGLIAFMLILHRLTKIFNPLNGSYDQLLKVLNILLEDGDSKSKKLAIQKFLSQVGYLNLDDYESLNAVKYKKVTESSTKCKEFENFLNTADEHALFNVAMFSDISNPEINFFALKFIEIGIKEPHKMKYLAYTAYRFQQIILHARQIAEHVAKSLDEEIEVMRKNEGKGSIPIINFAQFIGETYMYEEEFIPTKTLTNWLSLLSDLGDTVAIVETLKLCGLQYKVKDLENFKKIFGPLGVFGAVVKEEMKKICDQLDEHNETDSYIKYQESRRFQPADDAKLIKNFSLFLAELSKDKNVKFDYLTLYEFRHFDYESATNAIMWEVAKPTTNVIKLAQFFKSFCEFSVKLGKFVVDLKDIFLGKIAEMPVDRPDEIIKVGKLIGELRNLAIIEKYPQEKWLAMIESLEPLKNVKILEIHLDVLKVMMYNLYIHEEFKYMSYLKYINSIDISDPKYPPKIKSKVLQIIQNLIYKKFDKPSKYIFIRMKSGYKFDGIPRDVPESSPTEFDLHDFAKFYFLSASKNPFFIDSYLKSSKFLSIGPQRQNFGIILKRLLFERFKSITDPVYFDEHEAIPTLQFLLLANSRSIYRENSITPFLQNILEFKEFDAHKECLRTLVKMLKMSKFNIFPRADSHDIFCLLRRVQAKFIKIEDSAVDDSDEIEVWHIVDYQGYDQNDQNTKSIETSQLIWSFTENYQENRNKIQKMPKSEKPAQNIDSLAQNFKDWTKNFSKIQNPGRDVDNFEESQNLPQNAQNLVKNEQTTGRKSRKQINAENQLNSTQIQQKSSQANQRLQNSGLERSHFKRTRHEPKIEWNVTRDDLEDRSNLQNAELPNVRKRFDHNSPLYQGSRAAGRNDRRNERKN